MDARTKRSVNYLIRSLANLDDESLLGTFEEAETVSPKLAAACLLMASESNERLAISPTVFEGMKQEAAEDMYDEGPRAFGVVGGDVMEFGPQVGSDQIPF